MKRVIFIVLIIQTAYSQQLYPAREKVVRTFLEDAGWCWYQDPRAIIHQGKLIVGGISGVSGDIRVGVYDLDKQKSLGTVVLDKNFERDDHNAPVFFIRSDGNLLAMWAEHGHENVHYYKTSSSGDFLKWSERRKYVHKFEIPKGNRWSGVTYMNLYVLEDKNLLVNFFRDGTNFNPSFILSQNDGETWGNRTHFIKDEVSGRNRPYARYLQLNPNSIAVSFTDGHPRVYGNSIYYASFDGTSFFNAKGEKIKELSKGPLMPSESEKVYQGSETKSKPKGFESVPNSAWTCDLEKGKKDRPYLAYTLYIDNHDNRFRLANWNGKKWIDREIAYAGQGLYKKESSYTGLIALDPEDPKKVFISTPVDPNTGKENQGKHEIYLGRVKNKSNTSNIKWAQLTKGSKEKNIRPIVVSGEGYKVLLWLSGPWNTYTDYNSDVKGIVLEQP